MFLRAYPDSLNARRVCYTTDDIPEGEINCGVCKKCLRTRIELLVSGLEGACPTLPNKNVTAEEAGGISAFHSHEIEFLLEPIQRLREIGRSDIADVLEKRIEEFRHSERKKNLVKKIKGIDEAYLAGIVSKPRRFFKRFM